METLSNLRNRHKGQPAAVLGGGSSLAVDLLRVPPQSIMLSVNQRGLHLVDCHYMVYLDRPDRFSALLAAINTFQGLKISHQPGSDVDFDVEAWDGGFSAGLATWLACWMGCDPVLLCGMDCYQDERTPRFSLDDQLRAWRGALTNMGGHERIRAVSGPLVELFGAY